MISTATSTIKLDGEDKTVSLSNSLSADVFISSSCLILPIERYPNRVIPCLALFGFSNTKHLIVFSMGQKPSSVLKLWSIMAFSFSGVTETVLPQNRSELILYTFRGRAFTLLKVIRWS